MAEDQAQSDVIEKLVSLCKQRGFVYPSSEIYGGLNAVYDFGPLGVRLRRNIRNRWWQSMVDLRDDVEGIESAILMNPEVWVASGHVAGFTDPLVDCTGPCKKRWREDHLADERRARGKPARRAGLPRMRRCAHCGAAVQPHVQDVHRPCRGGRGADLAAPGDRAGDVRELRERGQLDEAPAPVRDRPAGQGISQRDLARQLCLPPARVRADGDGVLLQTRHGPRVARVLVRRAPPLARRRDGRAQRRISVCVAHAKEELSHYSTATSDIEYHYPFGWGELEGVADRTDFDLKTHMEHSGRDLSYFDTETNERYVPYVIEPAVSTDRIFITLLVDAYDEEEVRGEKRVVLHLHPDVAPVQVAVLPLSKKIGAHRARAPYRARAAAALRDDVRRDAGDRPALSPAGRDRHAACDHVRLRLAQRPGGDHPRTRRDVTGPGAHRGTAAMRCATSSTPVANARSLERTASTTGSIRAW